MYADIALPGVCYRVLGPNSKKLSFELLEQSGGNVFPKDIEDARKILALRKIQSDIMNTEHERSYSKIMSLLST